jgi:hypothetical protein
LWPINLHAGYGLTLAGGEGLSNVAFGADVATFSYKALIVDTVTMRAAVRSATGDFFVGTRVSAAWYPGTRRRRHHQLSAGLGLGVGSLGADLDDQHDAHAIVAPSVRYAFGGLVGLEVAAHLPVARGGSDYPVLVTVNLVGVLGLLLATVAKR